MLSPTRRAIRALWENRANLGYAWRVLNRSACVACGLGSRGLKDWTLGGGHGCWPRLEQLRLSTLPPLNPRALGELDLLTDRSATGLRALGRLPYPFLRRRGEPGFRRIAWEEALDLAAERIRVCVPERYALALTPSGLGNEVHYVAQKVVRFLGSPHVVNTADHRPARKALESALGVHAATASFADWTTSDLLVIVGRHALSTHPVAQRYVNQARRRGATVLCLDPPLGPAPAGSEVAFLSAVMHTLIAKDGVVRSFVDAHTEGYDDLVAELEGQDLDALVARSGRTRSAVFEFAADLCRAKNAVFVWSGDTDAHTVQALCNTALLRGFLGRAGSGVAPLDEHPGATGALDMGACGDRLPGEALCAESAAALSAAYGFHVPDEPGYTWGELCQAAAAGDLDVLHALGESSGPAVAEFGGVPLRIHHGHVVTPSMLQEPADAVLLLPAHTLAEQRGGSTITTAERRVIASPHVPGRSVAESCGAWETLVEIAQRAHPARARRIAVADPSAIREEIAARVPAYRGLERLSRRASVFAGGRLCAEGSCPTPDGRARLISGLPTD